MQIRAIKRITSICLLLQALTSGWAVAETAAEGVSISAIELEVASDNLEQFGFPLQSSEIAARVRANLAEWEYPLPLAGPYSHRLRARIGKISRRETPVGFSFSSGNSDPRARDFQKADVLPVECLFSQTGSDAVIGEAKSTFSAHSLDPEQGQTRVAEKLIDQIGTACLNLLEDLPRPARQQRSGSSTFKPKWMPDVRVEVKEVPVVPASSAAVTAVKPNNVEVKKEIIIHNQGTPVIFTFGHERK